jgi:hypothetical protein
LIQGNVGSGDRVRHHALTNSDSAMNGPRQRIAILRVILSRSQLLLEEARREGEVFLVQSLQKVVELTRAQLALVELEERSAAVIPFPTKQ